MDAAFIHVQVQIAIFGHLVECHYKRRWIVFPFRPIKVYVLCQGQADTKAQANADT
jgi:hypothetical protein